MSARKSLEGVGLRACGVRRRPVDVFQSCTAINGEIHLRDRRLKRASESPSSRGRLLKSGSYGHGPVQHDAKLRWSGDGVAGRAMHLVAGGRSPNGIELHPV